MSFLGLAMPTILILMYTCFTLRKGFDKNAEGRIMVKTNLLSASTIYYIVRYFRFDTYHDIFCTFSIHINNTNLSGNSSWTMEYRPVHPKMWSTINLLWPVFKASENPIWMEFSWGRPMSVYFRLRIGKKKQLKSSKTSRSWVVNDTNDTFSIRFGYQTVSKNRFYRYT